MPPQREVQPVYAPALVAFIGGIELSVSLGNQGNAPVGWFPLGPREAYVPSYTTDRAYYDRINRSEQVQKATLDDRWQRNERHEPPASGAANAPVNQRFAVVVPADTFVRSQPVARAALEGGAGQDRDRTGRARLGTAGADRVARCRQGADTKPGDTKPADAKAAPTTRPADAPATNGSGEDCRRRDADAGAARDTGEGHRERSEDRDDDDRSRPLRADGKHTAPAPALQPRTGAAPPKLAGAATPVPPTTTPGTHTGQAGDQTRSRQARNDGQARTGRAREGGTGACRAVAASQAGNQARSPQAGSDREARPGRAGEGPACRAATSSPGSARSLRSKPRRK